MWAGNIARDEAALFECLEDGAFGGLVHIHPRDARLECAKDCLLPQHMYIHNYM